MGMRFQRRIRILPWVYLNFGKGGISISLGPRGAKITIGKRGIKGSIGVPGTGIRYETPCCNPNGSIVSHPSASTPVATMNERGGGMVDLKTNMDKLCGLMGSKDRKQGCRGLAFKR